MRFIQFPEWITEPALCVDDGFRALFLITLSLFHFIALMLVARLKISIVLKLIICTILSLVPLVTFLLLYVASLPKG